MANIGIQRLSSRIRLVISDGLRKKLSDPRLERVASITKVTVTPDLSYADVSVSVMGTDGQQQAFMAALNRAHGVLQSMVARQLRTRACPTLRFHLDQSIKRGFETLQLIEKSAAERAERESGKAADAENETPPERG